MKILQRRGEDFRFIRRIAYHPPNFGWAPPIGDGCTLAHGSAAPCTISGQLYATQTLVMLRGPNGYEDFFSVDEVGNWCWFLGLDIHNVCLPTAEDLSK
jgi:hypothetical protein